MALSANPTQPLPFQRQNPKPVAFTAAEMGRFFPASINVYYSGDTLSWANRTQGMTLNQVQVAPIYAAEAMTLNNFQVNVTTGVATAVYRIGLWTIDNQVQPLQFAAGAQYATLLTDLGTVDCSTTGQKTISTAVNLDAEKWYLIGGVMQVASATLNVGNYSAGVGGVWGMVGQPTSSQQSSVALSMSGVSGALGAFTPVGPIANGHGVGFQRTA